MSSQERVKEDENERFCLLKDQKILSDEVALRLAKKSTVSSGMLAFFEEGDVLVVEGDDSQEVFFLLTGSVEIIINRRTLKTRRAGTVIGEMGALDARARRSATVKASEPVIALKVKYDEFLDILKEDNCHGWRQLSILLSERLKDYSTKTRLKNEKINVFIGSSSESFEHASVIAEYLRQSGVLAKTWEDGIFDVSGTMLSRLLDAAKSADFAIFIYAGDDVLRSRGKQYFTPRDNVHLEVGMFMGSLDDVERVILLIPAKSNVKIPSDLNGFIYKSFDSSSKEDLKLVAMTIVDRLKHLGPR